MRFMPKLTTKTQKLADTVAARSADAIGDVAPVYRLVVEELAQHYKCDPVGFCIDVLNFEPTPQQRRLMERTANTKKKKVVATSGHGIGKTRALGALVWWFMCTRCKAIVVCTAPTQHQLEDLLWKEITYLRGRMPQQLADWFEILTDEVYHRAYKEEWYCRARTARKDNPEGLQGFHNHALLILADEGCGVPDNIFETIENALTEEDNTMLTTTNPTRVNGYVYRATKDHRNFDYLKFSSLDSPLYRKEQAESIAIRYGKQSSVYRVRVLGEFPAQEEDQFIPLDVIEASMEREAPVLLHPIVWALDVARYGSDETVLAKRHGMDVMPLQGWYNASIEQTARRVMAEYNRTKPELRPKRIIIDCNGLGAGVYDIMKSRDYPVVEFMQAWTSSDPSRWKNAKCETYDTFKQFMMLGKLRLPMYRDDGELDNDLTGQLSSLKYKIDAQNGLLIIVDKDTMKTKYQVDSPDRAEAIIYTFFDMDADNSHVESEDELPWHVRAALGEGGIRRRAYDYDEFQDKAYNYGKRAR